MELVTTMVLLGILAVTALPRFIGTSSFSAYSVRSEFISALRQLQQQALSNTDQCYRMNVTQAGYQAEVSASCDTTYQALNPLSLSTSRIEWPNGTQVQFASSGAESFVLNFDRQGITQACNGRCINIIAGDSVGIDISAEGYIY